MNIKDSILLLGRLIFLAGCAKNTRDGRMTDLFAPDPYERLAEKISDGHKYLSNKKVAVLPFSYTDKRASDDGVVVSERLLTRIINRRELEVIERGLLERVLAELKLEHSGVIDKSSIKGLGKILGVEAVVTGTLTRRKDGRIEINARLIKTESASVLMAAAETVMPDWETSPSAPNTSGGGRVFVVVPKRTEPLPSPNPTGRRAIFAPLVKSNCPSGMVSYWNFDSGPDMPARDVFGGNPARLNGPVLTMDGKVNYGLDFKGQDYLKIEDCSGFNISNRITVEAWIKFRTVNFSESGSKLLAKGYSYSFVVGGGGNPNSTLAVEVALTPDTGTHLGNSRLSPNTWYHTAFTYDGSKVRLYLNGELDSSFSASGPVAPGNNYAFLGWDPTAAPGYHFPLDGV